MKKLIILFSITISFAQEVLIFQNPFEKNTTHDSYIENNISDKNISETNITEEVEEIILKDNFISLKPSLKLAVIIDKKKLFKFTPSIINSINAYLLNKDIKYSLKVFSIDENLSKISKNYKDIFVFATDREYIKNLKDYNSTFYVPVYSKEFNSTNIYFGGIEFKKQVKKISFYAQKKAVAINENTQISKILLNYEKELNITLKTFNYPNINYSELNDKFIFFNTSSGKTAQVLSNITVKEINTKLQLTTQINYNPILIEITQPQDIQKLLIANSIIKVPLIIEDTNLLLNSDIKYNWLNYATSILLNKIYNKITNSDEFYMSDFNLYIFNNQVNYKTKLYQIINGAFKPIE